MVNICLRLQDTVSLIHGDIQGAYSSTNECMHFHIDSKPYWSEVMVYGNDSADVGKGG